MIKKILHIYRKFFWTPEKYAKHQGVKIGKDCDIQKVSFGSEPYLIEIGNHVQITSGTKIFTHGGDGFFEINIQNWIISERLKLKTMFISVIIQ